MSRSELRIAAPDRRGDRDEMIDLIAKVFSHHGYFSFRDTCRQAYIGGSHYDWDVSRVAFLDGRMVAHWGVWGYDMRIGSARVRVGGIGAVATHADYRKRGLMARTARASLDAMRGCGYDMSLLFGIWDFYDRFGYVRAWGESTYVVPAGHLPADPPRFRCRKFAVRSRDDLVRIYNRENRRRTGTAVRPTYRRRPYLIRYEGLLWHDRRGEPAGWVAFRGNDCVDHGGDVDQVLRVLGVLARRRGWNEVRLPYLHHDAELCRRLRRGNCSCQTGYVRNGGPMICVVNLRGTLAKIAPELSRRVRNSGMAGWNGELLIAGARERVGLRIRRGSVQVGDPRPTRSAIRGGDWIAQLLIGTDEPGEVIEAGKIRLTGDARVLAEVLFPNQHPMLGTLDRM
ncbi:MAG TPA: GNAT family N-acetyltransferase [Phycisphaerae bacterium]|nr:GNAT family N-acetyltransferase [Phycisphaerae bacterium]